jgi:hypothetical protein
MTVDSKGYVWTCAGRGVALRPDDRDLADGQRAGSGGCMEDGEGTLFMSSGRAASSPIDTQTLVQSRRLPAARVRARHQHRLLRLRLGRVDRRQRVPRRPHEQRPFETFSDLVGAYTYSDMTGVALANVSPQ